MQAFQARLGHNRSCELPVVNGQTKISVYLWFANKRTSPPCLAPDRPRAPPPRVRTAAVHSNEGDKDENEENIGAAKQFCKAGGGGGGNRAGGKGHGGDDVPPEGGWPSKFPKWLQTWIWMTALVYLVARTKWRLDRWRLRREQEQEAAIQAQQDEEWQRFVEEYAHAPEASEESRTSGICEHRARAMTSHGRDCHQLSDS